MSDQQIGSRVGAFLFGLLGLTFFVLTCVATISRAQIQANIPGNDVATSGYQTFQNQVYLPIRAMITGNDPYGEDYSLFHPDGAGPVEVSPTVLALYSPFGFVSLQESQLAFLLISILATILVAWIIFRSARVASHWAILLVVSGLILICRPGLEELLGVGMVVMLMLGTIVALEYSKTNRFVAGLGFWLTTCNFAFAIPLAVFLFFRRDFATLVLGILITLGSWFAVASWIGQGEEFAVHRFGRDVVVPQLFGPFSENQINDLDQASWNRIDAQPLGLKLIRGEFFPQRQPDNPPVDNQEEPSNEPVLDKVAENQKSENDVNAVSWVRSNQDSDEEAVTSGAGAEAGSDTGAGADTPTAEDKGDLSVENETASEDERASGTESNGPTTLYEQIGETASYLGLENTLSLICLIFGSFCLLCERNEDQRFGVASRSGIFILLMMLLTLSHAFNDGILLWIPLVAILIGAERLVAGIGGFVRFLLVVLLLIPVFNFLSPTFIGDQVGLVAGTLEWNVVANINSLAIMIAALLVAGHLLFSSSAEDPGFDY